MTVKISSFGSKFMAMKHAMEYVRGLRYKLRSIRVPVVECTYIYGDNKSVLVNSGTLHLQLKKKSNSVAFHHVYEGFTLYEWKTTYINTHVNIADLMTKNLPSVIKRTKFSKMVLHFLTPSTEAGEESNHQAAVDEVKILPGQWIEAIIGAVNVWEEQATAQP